MVQPRSARDPDWLSLGPASRMLGVDPGTLRRWADGGRVQTFTTPGGRRRFARRSLEVLARARRGERPQLAHLGATPARLGAIYRRTYGEKRHADGGLPDVGSPDRASYRESGRRIVAVLLRFLDTTDEAERAAAERDAHIAAVEFARLIAAEGTSVGEGVRMFVAGRRPFLAELGRVAKRRGLPAEQLAALYEAASDLLDRLLVAFVESHAAATLGSRREAPANQTRSS